MNRLIRSLVISVVFSSIILLKPDTKWAVAGEMTAKVELNLVRCLQKGYPVEWGFDWQKPECSDAQKIEVKLEPTGQYPIPGGILPAAAIASGDWKGEAGDRRFQEKIKIEEWMAVSDLLSGRHRCRLLVELHQGVDLSSQEFSAEKPCGELFKNGIEVYADGPFTAVNNVAIRPVLKIKL